MQFFDSHMHTPLCGHSLGSPRDFVDAANANGISRITFTCHIPMVHDAFAQRGIRMAMSDFPEYEKLIRDAQAYARDTYEDLEVLFGIEAEIHPEASFMAEMHAFITDQPFDFVLGSLHHMLPAYRQWLAGSGKVTDKDIIETYFENLGQAAASNRYDSLSHPDVIRIYGSLRDRFNPSHHEATIKAALKEIAGSNTCMEINTSGMIKGDFIAHPDPLIMKWAIEKGIPFTIGSDSHRPETIGQFFPQLISTAKSHGLKHLNFFRQRKRIPVEIDI